MKATKLAWNVIEITPERQREKLATELVTSRAGPRSRCSP